MYLVRIYIEYSLMSLDHYFTYLSNDDSLSIGKRVIVNFNHKNIVGFIAGFEKTNRTEEELVKDFGYKLKFIEEIIDNENIMNEELMDLAHFMAKNTISPLMSCLNTILPPQLKPKKSNSKIIYDKWVRKTNNNNDKLTLKQQELLLKIDKPILYSDALKHSSSITKKLLELNLIEIFEEIKRVEVPKYDSFAEVKLNDEQKNAIDSIYHSTIPSLLYGITGSGKTEVYLQLTKMLVEENKQVLILVPEISLTPQMIKRFIGRFNNLVGVYHSGLSNTEKFHYYQMVKNNEIKIIVGTRSSVFLPFDNLGLIVMDEEHDNSYKQDKTPTYHVRDIVLQRAKTHKAKVVFGSATPTLESFAKGIKKVYNLVYLKKRVNNMLPEINIVDLNKVIAKNDNHIITKEMQKAIEKRISANEQVIILLNRRGFYPLLKCSECNNTLKCVHCDVALNYHHESKSLKCHMCGYEIKKPTPCGCGNKNYSTFGYGIQKVELELNNMFKEAKVLRVDKDTTSKKNAHENLLKAFENKEYNIMIGTQMIAKGLDFKDVTLVIILNADQGLGSLDYQSCENTFGLLMQACGRSGRHKQGEVILPLYNVNHFIINALKNQSYEYFFKEEMKYRHILKYPPYSYVVAVEFNDLKEINCINAVNYIENALDLVNIEHLKATALRKIKDKYRYRIIIKGSNLEQIKEELYNIVKGYYKMGFKTNINVDINPSYLG